MACLDSRAAQWWHSKCHLALLISFVLRKPSTTHENAQLFARANTVELKQVARVPKLMHKDLLSRWVYSGSRKGVVEVSAGCFKTFLDYPGRLATFTRMALRGINSNPWVLGVGN